MKALFWRQVNPMKVRIRKFLQSPERAWLYALLGTLYVCIRTRKFARVFVEDGVWIHQYRDGAVTDRHINYRLSLDQYTRDTSEYWFFAYHPRQGDTIIDIGAGKGEETHSFSQAVGPRGTVISIEAHPETFRCVVKLCQYNNLSNVHPLCAAICQREADVTIDNPHSDIMSSIGNAQQGFRVHGYTLDQVVEMFGIGTIDFVKMNIEGAEKLAIQGMTECMKNIRFICISCHDFLADQRHNEVFRTKALVEGFLKENGFIIRSRDGDRRPYIRDQVNAMNERFAPRS